MHVCIYACMYLCTQCMYLYMCLCFRTVLQRARPTKASAYNSPASLRYAFTRSACALCQHLRTAASTSCSPRTPRMVSSCPANEASAESSHVADDRTATRAPRSSAIEIMCLLQSCLNKCTMRMGLYVYIRISFALACQFEVQSALSCACMSKSGDCCSYV
jgi:hypothetical protein